MKPQVLSDCALVPYGYLLRRRRHAKAGGGHRESAVGAECADAAVSGIILKNGLSFSPREPLEEEKRQKG